MKKLIALTIAFVMIASAASAADALKPIVIQPNEFTNLMKYLNDQPYGMAAPVANFLIQKQMQAQTPAKPSGKAK